jgi:hypothetical protein
VPATSYAASSCGTSNGVAICLNAPDGVLSGDVVISAATSGSLSGVTAVIFYWGSSSSTGTHLLQDFSAPFQFTWRTDQYVDATQFLVARVQKNTSTLGSPISMQLSISNGNVGSVPQNPSNWASLFQPRAFVGDPVIAAVGDGGDGTTMSDQTAASVLGSEASIALFLGDLYEKAGQLAEAGEAVELRRDDLPSVASRDQDGWASFVPGQRADGVLGQFEVPAALGYRLAAPQHPPDLDVLLEPAHPALVVGAARRPLPLGRRQAPAHAEAEHDAAARDLVDVGDLVGEHDRVSQGRQEHGRSEPHAARDAGQVREGRQGLEPRLGDDAVAHPDGVVARAVGEPRHRPALLDCRPLGRLHDHAAGRDENAQSHAGR